MIAIKKNRIASDFGEREANPVRKSRPNGDFS
jgi:hypothetical protein